MRADVKAYRAFTLLELMVVVMIIGILTATIIPSLFRARELARRVKCLANVDQLTLAMLEYAYENRGYYSPFTTPGSDRLDHISMYLTHLGVTICPSTRNRVPMRTTSGRLRPEIAHLQKSAADRLDDTGGHSYETFGYFMGTFVFLDGKLIRGDVLKTEQTAKRANYAFILVDSDQGGSGGYGCGPGNLHNNYPDPMNNHGEAGVNVGFLDGHCEWVFATGLGHVYRRGWEGGMHWATGVHQVTGRPLDPGLRTRPVQRYGQTYQEYYYASEP